MYSLLILINLSSRASPYPFDLVSVSCALPPPMSSSPCRLCLSSSCQAPSLQHCVSLLNMRLSDNQQVAALCLCTALGVLLQYCLSMHECYHNGARMPDQAALQGCGSRVAGRGGKSSNFVFLRDDMHSGALVQIHKLILCAHSLDLLLCL